MCMIINPKVRIPKVNKNGFCVGYKIINVNNYSYYRNHLFEIGENISNRDSVFLTDSEKLTGEIIIGFHVFLSLNEAKPSLYYKIYSCKIIRVYFKPDDVVATGTWEGSSKEKNAVVTKLTVLSLKAIAEKRK